MKRYNPRQESLLPGFVTVFVEEGGYLEAVMDYPLPNLIAECRWKCKVHHDIEDFRLAYDYSFDTGWIVERTVGGRGSKIYRFQADYQWADLDEWVEVRISRISDMNQVPAELLA